MLLSKSDFTVLYNQKSKELLGKEPSSDDIDADYEGYIAVSQQVGQDAELDFYKETDGTLGMDCVFK